MDKETVLNNIFNSDPLELLEVKAKNPVITANDRLIATFEEINDFYEKNGCEPQKVTDITERGLHSRLDGIRKNREKCEYLKKYDRFHLLSNQEISSIEDIFKNDPLGLLDSSKEDIFNLEHIPNIEKERAEADFVARRKKLKDFEKYEAMFMECQKDLKKGKRKLVKFNERFLKKGAFFILKGALTYLEDIESPKKDKNYKLDGRTTTIFENGTYSNMLLRSLGKGLYEDGCFVSEHEDRVLDKLRPISSEDKQNGFIYILKSLSSDDRIITKQNLYKIGFSTTAVEIRIKNAKQDPTYLMADVQIVSLYEVYNVNPHKLEKLIHQFFGNSCLDIEIFDGEGKVYRPREWFIAPLSVIEEAIGLIENGQIIKYRYDDVNEKIILKGTSNNPIH